MRVLVVGSGGREHALVWKLHQSPLVKEIYCAPGNSGTSKIATNAAINAEDISGLIEFASRKGIDLTVVGPEAPLIGGIENKFSKKGLKLFGPSKDGAEIEGNKAFAKSLMKKCKIPTAEFQTFKNRNSAVEYIKERGVPIVIKASGLAAGKGVIVAYDFDEAFRVVDMIMVEKKFGDAGKQIIVEEYLEGEEASAIAFTDGETILSLLPSQDHKPIYDGDKGPNTGGMGAYAPAPLIDKSLLTKIEDEILKPIVCGMRDEGRLYKGVLYAGLMITKDGPKVLEFNCRFGDPETQPILPLLETDIVEIMLATVDGRLDEIEIKWMNKFGVCVVIASGGYPGSYEKGKKIEDIDTLDELDDIIVFHAGTKYERENLVTSGGRVLGVTGIGDTLKGTINKTYKAVKKIKFENMYYRTDIGAKGLGSVQQITNSLDN